MLNLNIEEQYPDFFIDYVWDFYSPDSDLYPIKGLTKNDIFEALKIYLDRILKGDLEYVHYSWGEGDSLDRERVRDIILEQPQFAGPLTIKEVN